MSRRHIALIIALCAGLGVLAWVELRQVEPSYQGKPLRFWLEVYSENQPNQMEGRDSPQSQQLLQQPSNAITQIGTNAIPVLLSMLQDKDAPAKSNLIVFLRRQSFIRMSPHPAFEYNYMAVCGFQALGPMGKPAVPVLIHLLEDPDLRWSAAQSLGWIGPASGEAVPILTSWLAHTNDADRYCAAEALGRIGSAARSAQPALLEHLNDSDEFVRCAIELALARQKADPEILIPRLIQELQDDFAARRFVPSEVEALAAFGPRAEPAVPILLQLLSKIGEPPHEIVADALKQIDPEAATNSVFLHGEESRKMPKSM